MGPFSNERCGSEEAMRATEVFGSREGIGMLGRSGGWRGARLEQRVITCFVRCWRVVTGQTGLCFCRSRRLCFYSGGLVGTVL